jgi:hypothetical protein
MNGAPDSGTTRSATPDGERGAAPTDPPVSTRVATLQRRLDGGDRHAIDDFWQEVAAEGTPLIEPVPGDDEHVLVTFVWREGSSPSEHVPLRTVVVVSLLTGPDLPNHQLRRLPGTDLWHRSYPVRTDVRTTYGLAPGDAVLSVFDGDRERADERLGALWRQGGIVPDPLNRAPFPESGPPRMSGLVLPDAAPQPWLAARAGVPAGAVERQRFRSAILDNDRPAPGRGRPHAAGDQPAPARRAARQGLRGALLRGRRRPRLRLVAGHPGRRAAGAAGLAVGG